jgi:O-antigen ligase
MHKWLTTNRLSQLEGVVAGLYLLLTAVAIATQNLWVLLVPSFLLIIPRLLTSRQTLYYALFFFIPFSFDSTFVGDTQLAFPLEAIMLLLTAWLFLPIDSGKKIREEIIRHPLTLLLALHLSWIVLATISSIDPVVSTKFFLAKLWFIGAFYLTTWYCIRRPDQFERMWWFFYIALLLSVIYVFFHHWTLGLTFSKVNKAVGLFYQNHVDYACLMVLVYPLLWIVRKWYPLRSTAGLLNLLGMIFLPIAIYFSFTRVAIGLLFLYPIIFAILHYRLLRPLLVLSAITAVLGISYLLSERSYLEYAPNYERTIYHDEFGNLLEATYNLEDLSTMERVNRWVAARHMTVDYPWTGTGPGTFHPTYKSYTVRSFLTYMSDNPEQSGVHNYFLMTLTDQGWPGLLIWLALVVSTLLIMERLYHSGRLHPSDRRLLAGLFCVFCGLIVINLLNDMIEHFKVGVLFFWILALVGLLSYGHRLAPDHK